MSLIYSRDAFLFDGVVGVSDVVFNDAPDGDNVVCFDTNDRGGGRRWVQRERPRKRTLKVEGPVVPARRNCNRARRGELIAIAEPG